MAGMIGRDEVVRELLRVYRLDDQGGYYEIVEGNNG